MQAARTLHDAIERAGLTKSALSASSGVSRSLIDDYLKGRREPSMAQLTRLLAAAGFAWHGRLEPVPRTVSPEFLAVLDFGDAFPRRTESPPTNLGPTWRSAVERRSA